MTLLNIVILGALERIRVTDNGNGIPYGEAELLFAAWAVLRAGGSPKVRLELINLARNQTNRVEMTRGKFLTSG
jgi:hypothetical protein